jgi:hypothetical protein
LENEKKRKDLNDLGNNLVTMEGLSKARNDDQKALKSVMAQEWINDMEKNKQRRAMNRAKEIQDDMTRLEKEKQYKDDTAERDKAKKNQWLKDQEEMIQFKEYMRDRDKELAMKEH